KNGSTGPTVVYQQADAEFLLRGDVRAAGDKLVGRLFPAWFEDVDYCRRLARAGKEIWVVTQAQARPLGGASLEHVPFGRFIEVWYGNMWRYARKWFSPAQAEALRWIIMMGMILRLPAAAIGIAHPEVGRRAA